MISGLSLVDLEKWKNEELEKTTDVIRSVIDKLENEKEIPLLDFAPEFKNILRDKTYGPWSPPGDIQIMLWSPTLNLANVLDKEKPVPSILIVPINPSRREFHQRKDGKILSCKNTQNMTLDHGRIGQGTFSPMK
jgi:hypothetical protein